MFTNQNSAQYPALYHAHHSLDQEDLPFWLELASQADGTVLELGCGTGRILLPLAVQGHLVFGLDNNLEMLRFCAARFAAVQATPARLLQADMRCYHFDAQFGLILLPCNTLSTLSDPDLHSMLACTARHLKPGAVFAASVPNPNLLARLPRHSAAEMEEIFPHPVDGEPVQVSSAWEHDQQTFTLNWFYDHLLPDGQVERFTSEVQHHLRPAQGYLEAFTAAGFDSIQCYGNFHRASYRVNSSTLVMIARRQPGEKPY
jgi:SAM-dependent methyltransferase